MQRFCFYILLGLLFCQKGFAQKHKPIQVLIVGAGPAAIAAGIQSARSGVQTLILSESANWKMLGFSNTEALNNPIFLQSGIGAELLSHYYKKSSSTEKIKPEPDSVSNILKSICDTVKNLKVLHDVKVQELKKIGNNWQLRLSNAEKIKPLAIVDATANYHIITKAEAGIPKTAAIKPKWDESLFRTSVAAIDTDQILPIQGLIAEKTDNLLLVPFFQSPFSAMQAGQAAGATAAYCAFFKTNTKNLNVRLIQSELLTYKVTLIPFGDILPSDPNFLKIQHLALSGLANTGIQEHNGVLLWKSENTLSTEELRPLMKNFYSRSQIWFADHAAEKISIEETINLLMYTATRGEELKRNIQKNWKEELGLKSTFEPQRSINRLEFAVLLDTYLQPFNVRIDLDGQLLN